jgi:hypothetical protein
LSNTYSILNDECSLSLNTQVNVTVIDKTHSTSDHNVAINFAFNDNANKVMYDPKNNLLQGGKSRATKDINHGKQTRKRHRRGRGKRHDWVKFCIQQHK